MGLMRAALLAGSRKRVVARDGGAARRGETRHDTGNFVRIDMEQSRYTEATLHLCLAMRALGPHVGVCVQAYLRRTPADVEALIAGGAGIRLVKGAYQEPPALVLPDKRAVDEANVALARRLLG